MEKITASEKETFEFAKSFAKNLKGGEIIGLIGELGAGKTIFAKGLAAGLGIKQNITSPTFVLMKIYKTPKTQITNYKLPITTFVHIDAYRIKSPQDIAAIGAEEYFNRPDTITVIEWADKIYPLLLKKNSVAKKILPEGTMLVSIKNKDGNKRLIVFNHHPPQPKNS